MCIKNCSKPQKVERLLFSSLTLQPNDSFCISFVNIMKATDGTVKMHNMQSGERMSVGKALGKDFYSICPI